MTRNPPKEANLDVAPVFAHSAAGVRAPGDMHQRERSPVE